MTGYSFTTPVWDGGAWVTPAVAEVKVAPAAAEVKADRHANGPEDAVPGWEALNWPAHEDNVRRLRQRIFTAARDGDLGTLSLDPPSEFSPGAGRNSRSAL